MLQCQSRRHMWCLPLSTNVMLYLRICQNMKMLNNRQYNMSEPITSAILSKWMLSLAWVWVCSVSGAIMHALHELSKGNIKTALDFFSVVFIGTVCGVAWELAVSIVYGKDVFILGLAGILGAFFSLGGLTILVNRLLIWLTPMLSHIQCL